MPLLSEGKLLDSFKILLVGPTGSGKSIAAADFYKIGNVHFQDFDGRIKSVLNHYKSVPLAMERISYESYPSTRWKEFMDTTERFQDSPGPRYRGRKIDTLILDSVTSCSNTSIVYQLMAKDKIKTTKAGLPATSWDEINGETVWFTEMLEIYTNLNQLYGTNIIWIAHPVSKTLIQEGKSEALRYESIAAYGNKIPSIIPAKFDEVYRVKLEKIGVDKYRRLAITTLATEEDVIGRTSLDLPSKIDITDGLYTALARHLSLNTREEEKEKEKEKQQEEKHA